MHHSNNLAEENFHLQQNIINLQASLTDLKLDVIKKEKTSVEFTNLNTNLKQLTNDNFFLKEKLIRMENENIRKVEELKNKYEGEIKRLKQEIFLINHKHETIKRNEAYVKSIEQMNEELTQKIKQIEIHNKNNLQVEGEKYKIKIDEIRKKTLNVLSESKKHLQSQAVKNLGDSYKLTIMHNMQLRNELAASSEYLEELVQELKTKDGEIMSLKLKLELHENVEEIIVRNNRKMYNFMVNFCKKEESIKESKEKDIPFLIKKQNIQNFQKNGESDKNINNFAQTGHHFFKMIPSNEKKLKIEVRDNLTPIKQPLRTSTYSHNVTPDQETKKVMKVGRIKHLTRNEVSALNKHIRTKSLLDTFEKGLRTSTNFA
jgi:hypothetical protein